jgi:hypothetical protein
MNYKVSYVVRKADHPGAIINQKQAPQLGGKVQLGNLWCKIVEIKDLLPPTEDFAYLHVSCKPAEPPEDD